MGLDTSSLAGGLSSIQSAVQGALAALIGQWGCETRLYSLSAPNSQVSLPADLMVESFVLHEAVSQPFALYINALVLDAHVQLKQLTARPITLHTTLADGGRARRSGYVVQADSLESDGGFARKGLLVQPWIALLGHTLCSRVWQGKSVIEIVEDVFAEHGTIAAWRWDEGVADYVAGGMFARNGASVHIASSIEKLIWNLCSACWPKKDSAGAWKKTKPPPAATPWSSLPTVPSSLKTRPVPAA